MACCASSALAILYAQGRRLPREPACPSRTAFGLGHGLKTEFFATPDWTGRPVATLTQPAIQDDWENAEPVPQLATHDYSVRWTGTLAVPAPGITSSLSSRATAFLNAS